MNNNDFSNSLNTNHHQQHTNNNNNLNNNHLSSSNNNLNTNNNIIDNHSSYNSTNNNITLNNNNNFNLRAPSSNLTDYLNNNYFSPLSPPLSFNNNSNSNNSGSGNLINFQNNSNSNSNNSDFPSPNYLNYSSGSVNNRLIHFNKPKNYQNNNNFNYNRKLNHYNHHQQHNSSNNMSEISEFSNSKNIFGGSTGCSNVLSNSFNNILNNSIGIHSNSTSSNSSSHNNNSSSNIHNENELTGGIGSNAPLSYSYENLFNNMYNEIQHQHQHHSSSVSTTTTTTSNSNNLSIHSNHHHLLGFQNITSSDISSPSPPSSTSIIVSSPSSVQVSPLQSPSTQLSPMPPNTPDSNNNSNYINKNILSQTTTITQNNNNNNIQLSSTISKKKRDFDQTFSKDEWEDYPPPSKYYQLYNYVKTDITNSFTFKVKRTDKNIQFSDLDNAWILYRQNRFQVDCDIIGSLESWSNNEKNNILYVNSGNSNGLVEVTGLFFTLYVLKFSNSSSIVCGNDQNDRVPIHQLGGATGKKDRLTVEPSPVIKGRGCWSKLQFGSATSNNARIHPDQPNPHQQFFRVVITLNAIVDRNLETVNSNSLQSCQFFPIHSKISPPMIVRGQNPGRFLNHDKSLKKDPNSSPNSNNKSNQNQNNSGSNNSSNNSNNSNSGNNNSNNYNNNSNNSNNNLYNQFNSSSDDEKQQSSSPPSSLQDNSPPQIQIKNDSILQIQDDLQPQQQQQQKDGFQQQELQNLFDFNKFTSATTATTTTTSNPFQESLFVVDNINLDSNKTTNIMIDSNPIDLNSLLQQQQQLQQQIELTTTSLSSDKIIFTNQTSITTTNDNNNNTNNNNNNPFQYLNNPISNSNLQSNIFPTTSINNNNISNIPSQQQLKLQQQQQIIQQQQLISTPIILTEPINNKTNNNLIINNKIAKWNKNPFLPESIYTNNKVGINTTTPSQALTVNGNIMVTGELFKPSDKRIKSNIKHDTSDHWDKINRLKLYDYDRKKMMGYDDPNVSPNSKVVKEKGFLAQEVKEVMPNAVKVAGEVKLQDGSVIPNLLVVNDRVLLLENIGATQQIGRTLKKEQEHIIDLDRDLDRVKLEGKRENHAILTRMQDIVNFMHSEETDRLNSDESCVYCSLMGLGPAWTMYIFGFFFPFCWLIGSFFLFSPTRVKWVSGLVNFISCALFSVTTTLLSFYVPQYAFAVLVPSLLLMGIFTIIIVGFFRQRNREKKRYLRERLKLMRSDGYKNLVDHVDSFRNDYNNTKQKHKILKKKKRVLVNNSGISNNNGNSNHFIDNGIGNSNHVKFNSGIDNKQQHSTIEMDEIKFTKEDLKNSFVEDFKKSSSSNHKNFQEIPLQEIIQNIGIKGKRNTNLTKSKSSRSVSISSSLNNSLKNNSYLNNSNNFNNNNNIAQLQLSKSPSESQLKSELNNNSNSNSNSNNSVSLANQIIKNGIVINTPTIETD